MPTTNLLPPVATPAGPSDPAIAPQQPVEAGVATVLGLVGQLICALHGHDYVRQFGRERVYLKCISCGHESPGWIVGTRRPRAAQSPQTEGRPTTRAA